MKQYSKVFIYLRFSSEGQEDGNSFERQREAAKGYLRRAGIPESIVEWVEDPAMSAFTGEHIEVGALGRLLKRIRAKTIANGLIIFEAVDRASRQGSLKFSVMLSEILEAGFSIYFLDDETTGAFNVDNAPPFLHTILSLKADLANFESARKSGFSSDNWERRRNLARTQGTPITGECPRWLKVENQQYVIDEERATSINKAFRLVLEGWGISRIVRFANANGWPVPGNGNTWHTSLLNRLFSNRALIGEFQPHEGMKAKRRPSGTPISNYYPIAVEPELFYAVLGRRAMAATFPNRKDANNFNYLMGLGKCACGGTWRRMNKNSGKQRGYAQYSCSRRQIGASDCANLPAKVFDYSFIGLACERIPELLTVVDDKRAATIMSLQSELADIERRLKRVLALYESSDADDVIEVGKRLKALKTERRLAVEKLTELETLAPPSGPFDFGDALTAYLPAFLDTYEENESEEAQLAFNARALFRLRVMEAVSSVTVAENRETMSVKLRNDVSFEIAIRNVEFSTASEYTDWEIEEMRAAERKAQGKALGL